MELHSGGRLSLHARRRAVAAGHSAVDDRTHRLFGRPVVVASVLRWMGLPTSRRLADAGGRQKITLERERFDCASSSERAWRHAAVIGDCNAHGSDINRPIAQAV